MARFARIDLQIRATRLILANRFRVAELNPFFCELRFGDARESLARYEFFFWHRFARIDSRESFNGPDSRCESPGHLRSPIQDKKPEIHPEILPKYTPNLPPPKLKYRTISKIIPIWVILYIYHFFSISVLEGDLGSISGWILGFRGVLCFVCGDV